MNSPRPLLIGVVQIPDGLNVRQWRDRRLTLSLRANEEGYALLELFEVSGVPAIDESVYVAIELIATRIEVAAIMTLGLVAAHRVEGIAERARMRVVTF